jgi:hypothetical protein
MAHWPAAVIKDSRLVTFITPSYISNTALLNL